MKVYVNGVYDENKTIYELTKEDAEDTKAAEMQNVKAKTEKA